MASLNAAFRVGWSTAVETACSRIEIGYRRRIAVSVNASAISSR